MGDSLGDSNMAEGVQGSGAILKIGFLSVNVSIKVHKKISQSS